MCIKTIEISWPYLLSSYLDVEKKKNDDTSASKVVGNSRRKENLINKERKSVFLLLDCLADWPDSITTAAAGGGRKYLLDVRSQ